ncbi:MAG: hexitol phosphatase HxpB [Parashewanella sp.]
MKMKSIRAVIFDMDGVLVDSEPVWQQAELNILQPLGVPITHADTLLTTGLRVDELVQYWYRSHPWDNYDNQQTSNDIIEAVITFIKANAKPMQGVIEALTACKSHNLKIGLATSSSMNIVNAVLTKLNIAHYFDKIHSAEHLPYGKPHPEVYLNCATDLGVQPRQCLAIEDSFNGLIAARAANMQTLAIPPQELQHQDRWVIAHHNASNLTELPQIISSI